MAVAVAQVVSLEVVEDPEDQEVAVVEIGHQVVQTLL
jgi:hypothetical protein